MAPDHGVERAVGDLVEHDGVERLSRGLDADMGEHRVAAIALQRVAVHEGLGDGLDGEGAIGVPHRVDLAVDGGEGDAEGGRIGLAELGDVIGGVSPGQSRDALMQLREITLDGR